MNKTIATVALLAALGVAFPALAGSDDVSCGNLPRDQWIAVDAASAKAAALGYDVRSVEIEHGCYEIKAVDKNGARAELYLNPVSGEIVRTKEDD